MSLNIVPFSSGQLDYIARLNDIIDQATGAISEASDVNFAGFDTGNVLMWNATSGKFEAGAVLTTGSMSGYATTAQLADYATILQLNAAVSGLQNASQVQALIDASLAGYSPGAQPYYITVWIPFKPTASEVLLRHKFTVPVTFPAGMTGSQLDFLDLPTADTTISVKRISGATTTYYAIIGISTAGVITVVAGSAITFAVGDIMEVEAASTADVTFGRIDFTLAGTR